MLHHFVLSMAKTQHNGRQCWVRLVPPVGSLYINLDYAILIFSLPLNHQHSSSSLQHLTLIHISISNIIILSSIQHHHFTFNHFRIYFLDNKIQKIIV
jgi:hypothetical protein